jgi:hypothetical protein
LGLAAKNGRVSASERHFPSHKIHCLDGKARRAFRPFRLHFSAERLRSFGCERVIPDESVESLDAVPSVAAPRCSCAIGSDILSRRNEVSHCHGDEKIDWHPHPFGRRSEDESQG